MVKYMVHATVNFEVFDRYLNWLQTEHVNEVLSQKGFIAAEICWKKGGALAASSKEVKVIYELDSEESLKDYLAGPAMTLREKGIELFPGQFSAQREVWLEGQKLTATK